MYINTIYPSERSTALLSVTSFLALRRRAGLFLRYRTVPMMPATGGFDHRHGYCLLLLLLLLLQYCCYCCYMLLLLLLLLLPMAS